MMSTSDGLDPYIFPSKDGKDADYERRNGRRGAFPRQNRHFFFTDSMVKVLLPIWILNWCVINYVCRRGKGINRRNESIISIVYIASFWYCTKFDIINCSFLLKPFFLRIEEINVFWYKIKNQSSLHIWQSFSLRIVATLRIEKKLAAVSRETPENTKNNQWQNTLYPGMAEEYITQVSEEVVGRVTKTLSQKLADRSHAFWVLCLNSMNFFWTHKFGRVSWLFRQHPGTTTQRTGNPLGIVP